MQGATKSRANASRELSREDIVELTASVRQAFFEGTLTLAQICGLTGEELRALRREAERRARRGQLQRAVGLYGLLAACDPYEPRSWQRLGDLQRRLREPGAALACYQTALLVGGDAKQLVAKLTACARQLERAAGEQPTAAGAAATHAYR